MTKPLEFYHTPGMQRNNIVRQPYLEEIIQSVLRRQNITADAQTFIQKARLFVP
jgi:hypothetical protein